MATVRLEFELDSEVYPELHAALSALKSTRARAERMRQLAAAGLVWEKVRLQSTPGQRRELPVLMDVVADLRPLAELHDDEPEDEPPPWGEVADSTLHVTALAHKPATRSRLMRMKERGLFKNG